MRRLWIAILVVVFVPALASAQKRGLLPQDYYKMSFVSDVTMSPPGDHVAFTVTTVVEKDNRRHREVWVQRLKGGAPDGKPFRFTDPTREASAPVWSPDGSLLSFNSRRSGDKNATWFVRLVPPSGEALHIDGVEGAPVWSPDGKWIAYLKEPGEASSEEPDPKNREGWISPGAVSHTLDAKRFDGHVVTSTRTKRDGTLTLLPDPSVRKKNQLFVVAAAGGAPKQVTTAAYAVRGVLWSADNQTLLFTADESEDNEYNTDLLADIYAVSTNGGPVRKLTTNPGSESQPALSPKGDRLAFVQTKTRGGEADLMVVDVGPDGTFKGQPRSLTASWDDDPGEPMWTADGNAVRFGADVSGDAHLFEASLQGSVRRASTSGERHLGSFSVSRDGSVMAYTVDSVFHPTEAFLAKADGSNERQLTTFNQQWLSEVTIVPPEQLTWKVADGTTIEGWLVKPLNYAGSEVSARAQDPWRAARRLRHGMVRYVPDPRRSGDVRALFQPPGIDGYGHKFTYATRGKWGEMDQEDFLKGIDTAMAKYPDIDGNRLGVSGGSYGGFMTNWLTAETDRFVAAVTSRSITTWESWYGSSDARG